MHPSHSRFHNLINPLMKESGGERGQGERGNGEMAALTL